MDTIQLEELRNTIYSLIKPVIPKEEIFIGILLHATLDSGVTETSVFCNLQGDDVEEALIRSLLDLHLGRKGKLPFKSTLR